MSGQPLTLFISFPTSPLTDHLSSGDGLIAFQFIRRLAERGHRIHVATTHAVLREALPANVKLYQKHIEGSRKKVRAMSYLLWSRGVLKDINRSEHIDLIHELNPVLSLCSLAFAGSGIPVVLGPHSSRWPLRTSEAGFWKQYWAKTKLWMKDAVVRQQHRHASAILLSTTAALNNVWAPEDCLNKLFILPPGLDVEAFSPSTKVSEQEPTVLFLANVLKRKGIFTTLQAFERLSVRMPRARLVVAGAGGELNAVERYVAASSFRSRVTFLGRVDHARVADVMRSCMVYCMPSHGEPFGMTAVEAMACGKPLVVTAAGGLAHIVSHRGGRQVPVDNPESLAEALEELLTQPELCRKMGAFNRREAETKYAWPVVTERLEAIYRTVIGEPDQAVRALALERTDIREKKPAFASAAVRLSSLYPEQGEICR